MLDLSYPAMLSVFPEHLDPRRSESASFLIWYLENFLRLDTLDAVDSVCDQRGDKGVDGIYLNEAANAIEVYQSKISQRANATIGDTILKEFAGTLSQFESEISIENILETAPTREVAKLIERLELIRRRSELDVKGIFVCNSELDANGAAFLATAPHIRFIGRSEIESSYVSPERTLPVTDLVSFDVSGFETSKYVVDADHETIIAPILASELVALNGIANQILFAYNVRGALGKTQVNKDITSSIKNPGRHKLFPLFHNGITIIAAEVQRNDEIISLKDYFVVNGCQSLTALYTNRNSITADLRVLTKIVRASPSSQLAEMVTRFSNNQNGVKARDFKSNNRIQIRLQNEMRQFYGHEFRYEIKRGEESDPCEEISNETAGLYLMAFDLKHPWGTHRKYQVFEDLHADLFGRPTVTAHRIVFYHLIFKLIEKAVKGLANGLVAKYVLTKYLVLYIIRLVLEKDALGEAAIAAPEQFVSEEPSREALLSAISSILDEIITDLNAELDQLPEDFDYRGKLRDEKWADKLAHEIVGIHEKLVSRKRLQSIGDLYHANLATARAALI